MGPRLAGKSVICVVIALLAALAISCAQATPTPAPKAAPAKEAKLDAKAAKEAKPETKEAKPAAKEPKPEAKKEEKRPVKIKVAYSVISGPIAPLWITKEMGIFEKHGLDAELVYIATGPTIAQSMAAGELALANTGGGPVVSANLGGADQVIIAGMTNILVFGLYGQANIQRIEDLKGKAIGVSRYGSPTDFAARWTLKKYGLEPDRDVALLQTGGVPETLGALQAGGVQAGVFGIPSTLQARKAGLREVVNITDLGVPYVQNVIAVTKKYQSTNEETVRNFMKGYMEGIAAAKKDKAFSTKVIGKYTKTEDQEMLDETYDVYLIKTLPRVPYATTEGVQTILDETAREIPKAKDARPTDFIDHRILKELDESGFIKKLYGE